MRVNCLQRKIASIPLCTGLQHSSLFHNSTWDEWAPCYVAKSARNHVSGEMVACARPIILAMLLLKLKTFISAELGGGSVKARWPVQLAQARILAGMLGHGFQIG